MASTTISGLYHLLTRRTSLNISQNPPPRAGTTTLSSSEERNVPTFAIPSLTTHSGLSPPPKIGLPTSFIHALPPPPFLSSTVSHQSRDSENGPNPVPPRLRSIPYPKPRTGMMISKIRPTRLPGTHLHDLITSGPSFQKFLNPRIGMTTLTLASSCPPRRIQPGTRRTRRMTKKRTRPSPHILERSPSSSPLLLLPYPSFHFLLHLQERPSLAHQLCLFFPFPRDATRLRTHLWLIFPCVADLPPSPCYRLARLLKKGAGVYGRSRALQTTMSLSSLTGNKILLPYLLHPSPPPQTRPLRISPLLNPQTTTPDPPFCPVSGPSKGGGSARDARALVLVTLSPRASSLAKTRHPVPLHRSHRLHPARPAGFFGLPIRFNRHRDPR